MYVHLTTHSVYSLQEGLLSPAELVQAASQQGMTALGLTDHRLLTGAVEFVRACQQAGIQPVLGLEIDMEGRRLPLLATSVKGWRNLCRLSSALALRHDLQQPCSLDTLATFADELIAIDNPKGEGAGQRLGQMKDIFGDRLYLALQDPAVGQVVNGLAHRLAIPMVVTQPVFYLKPEQAGLKRVLTAIRLNRPLTEIPQVENEPQEGCFSGAGEMLRRFAGFKSALANSEEIAERCRFELPLGASNMPTIPLPPGETAASHLRRKAEDGARQRYGEITPEIQARLDHELEVIARMGYEPVFLIVEEVLEYARQTNVPYSSRGSAASSLVAHCLGITSPDPLRLNLYFERFLNPARRTPPDIDTDLCSRRRDRVIQHVFERYGQERVAMVGTVNRFRPRSALTEVAKAHGLPAEEVRRMSRQLPHAFWSRRMGSDGDSAPSPFAELRQAYPAARYQQIFEDAEAIIGLPRHLSVHPGGLIVAPGAVTELVPVMLSGSKGITITQLDLDSVEDLGLVKIDLLGIRGLTVVGDVAEFIQQGQPQKYADMLAVLDATPAEDEGTAEMVEHGQTIGCFQIESPGMRATLREIHARSEDDIMAALALYRPGPLTGGLKDAFVRRFKGEEAVSHLHPALAPLLDETFGVILYQEQVLRIAHELAGFSLAEADLLRRAMSHFDPGKKMQELQQKFVSQAQARSNIPPEVGERLWEMMAAFAGYGFPKAHAASYAQVAWRSAWCKTHFPLEFMAAVLANWGGYYSQRVYLSEARRMGLSVHPPHVNHSQVHFAVGQSIAADGQGQALYMGLDQVKHLTRRTMGRIMRLRPYSSLDDFLTRVDPRLQEAENLAKVGALQGLGTIPAILGRLQQGWRAGQMNLFAHDYSAGEDWTLEQKAEAQQQLLGISVDSHPLELLAEQVAAAGVTDLHDAATLVGRRVTVAGVRQTSRRSKTARGETMMFLSLEDLSGMMDVVIFPAVYQQARSLLNLRTPLLVSGVVELNQEHGEPYLRAEKLELLA